MRTRRKTAVRKRFRAKPVTAKLRWEKPRRIRTAEGIVDPYFEWALATKFAYYGKQMWLPVLLELNGVTVGQLKRKLARTKSAKNVLRLSPTGFESSTFCPAWVTEDFGPALKRDAPLRGMIKRFELSRGTGPMPRGGAR